ncbi:MAG TPA: hypothetical protein VJB59_05135 [Bdellovibrionota bacterium]|nr:hypothetical protein [Bdellovibrionota bacterium]
MKVAFFVSICALLIGASALASEPSCKVRTIGGSEQGLTFSFWYKVEAQSLEECQDEAKSLLDRTTSWKVFYKWRAGETKIKGSYTAETF